MIITEEELASAFVKQRNLDTEIHVPSTAQEFVDGMVAITPDVRGVPKPPLHVSGKGKGKEGKKRDASSDPKSAKKQDFETHESFIMPWNRYPVAMPLGMETTTPKDVDRYCVRFDVLKAVQYGAVFSPHFSSSGVERGYYVTSGIPINAIFEIENSTGSAMVPASLCSSKWHTCGTSDVQRFIKIQGKPEVPTLEKYHASLSPEEYESRNLMVKNVQSFHWNHQEAAYSTRGLTVRLPKEKLTYTEFESYRLVAKSFLKVTDDAGNLIVLKGQDDVSQVSSDAESSTSGRKGKKGKGKGKSKKDKPKGKGKGKNPETAPLDLVDPTKLVWVIKKGAKGTGRDIPKSFSAFSQEKLALMTSSIEDAAEEAIRLLKKRAPTGISSKEKLEGQGNRSFRHS